MSETALAVREKPGEMTLSATEVRQQVQLIQQLMKEVMVEGEHYGVVPGTDKPTLLKPGAEKLLLTFRMDPQYEIERAVEEERFIHYVVRCVLYHQSTGKRIASGLGSCNSREVKYRYRTASRTCPACGSESILKSKYDDCGWFCYAKKGGCGAKFAAGDPKIEKQEIGRVENPDIWDQNNTMIKMASKRALTAATLNATAASDIFTQDLEDMEDVGDSPTTGQGEVTTHESSTKPNGSAASRPTAVPPKNDTPKPKTGEQIYHLKKWRDDPRLKDIKDEKGTTLAHYVIVALNDNKISAVGAQKVIDACVERLGEPQSAPPPATAPENSGPITDDDIPF